VAAEVVVSQGKGSSPPIGEALLPLLDSKRGGPAEL